MTENDVIEELKKVIDMELGVNIVDLGLIYGVDIKNDKVKVKMTLTVPSCPMRNVLIKQVEEHLKAMEGIDEARIELVFDPPWNPSMMSEEIRKQFGVK